MTTFLRHSTYDFFPADGLEKSVRIKLLDTSYGLTVNANVLTDELENGCYPVSKGFLKCLGRQSPEDVREGVVRGCVPIELPAGVLCVLPPPSSDRLRAAERTAQITAMFYTPT